MISVTALCRRTGLSRATLNRWIEAGMIPRPDVRSHHRSRRGRVGYLPDSAVKRVRQISALQREGLSLAGIADRLEAERVANRPRPAPGENLDALLAAKTVTLPNGEPGTLRDLFLSTIIADAHRRFRFDPKLLGAYFRVMRDAMPLERARALLHNGFNPVALFYGDRVDVIPDVLVGPWLSNTENPSAYLLLPLKEPLRTCLKRVGIDSPAEHFIRPACIASIHDGDATVETPFGYVGADLELLPELGRVVQPVER